MKEPIDYLIIGHITQDKIEEDTYTLGGTVYYASQTAHILGFKAGIVTSIREDVDLSEFEDIPVVRKPSMYSTIFENSYAQRVRIQHIHNQAENLTLNDIPGIWRSTPIIHLGPIAREVDAEIASALKDSFIGITPQGWLRKWDDEGLVSFSDWEDAVNILPKVDACVLSIEDVAEDWSYIEKWKKYAKVLVVTMGREGATIFYNSKQIHIPAPRVNEVDLTGAGDVFSAAFFTRMYHSKDPVNAGKFAVSLASSSIEDHGLNGIKDKDKVSD